MKWDYLFSRKILDRGRQYYRAKRVRNLQQTGSTYQAEVIGSRVYNVTAQMINDKKPRMACDCPYAADGNKCKHMAAVLYAIADMNEIKSTSVKVQKPAEPKRIYPFKKNDNSEQEYRYFDMGRMTADLFFYDQTCAEAKRMADDGTVQLVEVNIGYKNSLRNVNVIGEAHGTVRVRGVEYSLRLAFAREGIKAAVCHVPGCYRNYDAHYSTRKEKTEVLCVHHIALLFLLEDYIRENNPGDSTDWNAMRMLMDYRETRAHQVMANDVDQNRQVVLEPRLEKDYAGLHLSFRVGVDKMYVVKNMTDFVECVEAKDIMQLGKTTELNFAQCDFTEKSRKYYEFISRNVNRELQRVRDLNYSARYYVEETKIKGNMGLYGERLDEFFDIAQGTAVLYTDKERGTSKKATIFLQEKDPDITLTIRPDIGIGDVFHGILVKGNMPDCMKGYRHRYYLEDGQLNRISEEKAEQLKPLLGLSSYENVLFRVGRKNLSEFYYTILPKLRECVDVQEEKAEQVEQYLPPEVAFIFYLDGEKNNATCRIKAMYGELECNVMDWLSGGAPKGDYRDGNRECEAMYCVRRYFPMIDVEQGLFHCGGDEDLVYKVLESGIEELLQLGEVQSTDYFRRLKIRRQAKVSVGVSVKSDILDLTIASEELSQEELLDILYSYQRKKKYYRLRNGDFLQMEDDSLGELAAMLEAMHVSPKEFVRGNMQIPVYRALYLDKMLEQSEGLYANRDKRFKKLVKEFKTVGDSDFEMPESLRPVMRNYQNFGYKWLRTLESCGFGGVLADDMGLGKTLQMISVFLAAKEEGSQGTSLVVAPASLVYNWQEEFSRFAPELSVCPVVGTQKERREKIHAYQKWDVLVTSYDLLKRDIAEYEDAEFHYQVLDEAQYIKNHTTAAAKSVKIIRSKTRFALTGTPIENRLSELWSIFDYLMPGFLYGYDTFKSELETPIARNKDENATQRLKRMVAPFILRRLKKDVLRDLPDKMEETRYAKMEKSQQQVYDGQVVHMREVLNNQSEENFQKNKFQILAELTKIRQICCDPSLLLEDYKGESAKREACMDLIQSAIEGEHKMLVFSQFTSMLELLEQDLKKEKISYYKITGSTPKKQRLEMVRIFNEDDTPVFLISLKAGGVGLNLTGADVVIHYDPWWNLAVQNQATDRAHRIGQTKVVSVYKLIVKGSIEEKILHMQESKKNLADAILNGETGGIANMSKEELLELIQS